MSGQSIAYIPEDASEPILTTLQAAFIEHFLTDANGNGRLAAELAGYKADNQNSLYVQASTNLKLPKVRAVLSKALAERGLTPEETVYFLSETARSNVADFIRDDGTWDFAKARADGHLYRLQGFKRRTRTRQGTVEVEEEIVLPDRVQALSVMARIHKLLGTVNNVQATQVNVNVSQMTPEERDARLTNLLAQVSNSQTVVRAMEEYEQAPMPDDCDIPPEDDSY